MATQSSFQGSETISDLSSATGFSSIPARANVAVVQPFTQNVRYRSSGIPTASVGFQIKAGTPVTIRTNLEDVQFIEESASATMFVEFFYERSGPLAPNIV